MEDAVLTEVASLNPAALLGRIRRDPVTGLGSVYDVIRLINKCGYTHVTTRWARFHEQYPETHSKVVEKYKFAGKRLPKLWYLR